MKNVRRDVIFVIVIMFLLFVFIFVYNNRMPIEKEPSLVFNYTGMIKRSCYYEGRQFGCKRNITRLVNEENIRK